ncbi:MAG: Asp-tRNA(Asn)/Glu-tRNA(Gln) amidotransferase subunit GatC [Schleiferiaceae bacterium]|nr:Asp-tRNA(Asn)/Glu-tRNA(Gln) amidotransferase subunit GatC [Schleiferiaceae bacterium]
MKITKEEIQKLAHLSRLSFNEQELENFTSDMDKILGFVDKIQELDLEGVTPLVYLNENAHVLREDEVIQSITHEEALKNAPQRDTDYFRVPKVINN